MDRTFNIQGWEEIIASIGVAVAALLAGVVICRILFHLLPRLLRRADVPTVAILPERLRGPSRILIPLLTLILVAPSLAFPAKMLEVIQHLLSLGFIGVAGWLFIAATFAGRDVVISRYDVEARDNLKARAIYTQLTVMVKIIVVIVIIISGATMLMTFDKIRQVGVSILASAGILGIIVGFAAQRSIATLFAGLQIALTQPIRINDLVIVEGESGWVEEITLTYVVIRIWDLRRLVVPVTYFLEKSFQNWTWATANLLGTVYVYADYTVPVEEIRRKLHEILLKSDKWDKQAWGLQVTNTTEHAVELRALLSAEDSSKVWDLRCEVREKLLAFLQDSYPWSLPRVRAELRMEETPGRGAGPSN